MRKGDWELVYGYPYAMAPSSNRNHLWFSKKFTTQVIKEFEKPSLKCNGAAYYELDWTIGENSVVRLDCITVCGNFTKKFSGFPPTLVVEISSKKTKLSYKNTNYNL